MDDLFSRAERIATYAALTLLLLSELVARFVPPVRHVVDGGGAIILLAIALLLVFRIVDRHVLDVAPAVRQVTFSDGIRRLLASRRTRHMRVCAFDGLKYYEFISERRPRIDRLDVLVVDPVQAYKWKRLAERRIAGRVEIRRCDVGPVLHYLLCDADAALFGPLLRGNGGVETSRFFLARDSNPSGVALVDDLRTHFDHEWTIAQVVVNRSEETVSTGSVETSDAPR